MTQWKGSAVAFMSEKKTYRNYLKGFEVLSMSAEIRSFGALLEPIVYSDK